MPTREQKLKTIRDACVKPNPDIMKLEFGCRLYHPEYKIDRIVERCGTGNGGTEKIYTEFGHKFYHEYITDKNPKTLMRSTFAPREDWEILGRDIRLADVLLAIGKSKDNSPANIGGFTRDLLNNGYNLLKDNLEDQSDETIDFIYKITH